MKITVIVHLIVNLMVTVKEISSGHRFEPVRNLYYGNHHPHFERLPSKSPPVTEPFFKEIEDYFSNECKCLLLNECKSMLFLLTKFKSILPEWLTEKVRAASCGYYNGQRKICCPFDKYGLLEKELEDNINDIWIWDEVSHNKSTNQWKPIIKENKDLERYENMLIDFEDGKTYKNCPKILHDNYDFDNDYISSFDYHSFEEKKEARNKFKSLRDYIVTTPLRKEVKFKNFDYCGISVRSKSVRENKKVTGQLPWMSRIAYINSTSKVISYRCAGSVLSQSYVLTAAHCVTNLVDDLKVLFVRVGDLRVTRKLDCDKEALACKFQQDFEIDQIISHPNYDQPKYANDIALIKYKNTNPSQRIIPICLPLDSFINYNEKFGVLVGWNSNYEEKTTGKSNLKYIKLPVVNNSICAKTYAEFSANSRFPITISSSQMCVQGHGENDACQGDSGGPLMREESEKTFTIVGLVSFGPSSCGISNFPGVYTKIDSFLPWILQSVDLDVH